MQTNIHIHDFWLSVFFCSKLIAKYGSLSQKRREKNGNSEKTEKNREDFWVLDKIGAAFCRTNDESLLCILFFGFFQYFFNFKKNERERKTGERIKNWQINLSCFYQMLKANRRHRLYLLKMDWKTRAHTVKREKTVYFVISSIYVIYPLAKSK